MSRVVLCSGKVYYDLAAKRDEEKLHHVKILRVEQLYPFPQKALVAFLEKTPKADVIWCQEEPQNMGSWHFVRDDIEQAMMKIAMATQRPEYAGRKAAASPATGSGSRHNREQEQLVKQALGIA